MFQDYARLNHWFLETHAIIFFFIFFYNTPFCKNKAAWFTKPKGMCEITGILKSFMLFVALAWTNMNHWDALVKIYLYHKTFVG